MLISSMVTLILLGTIAPNVCAYKSYSKHQLWRLRIKNNEQVAKMLEFSRLAHLHNINFWSEEFRMNVPVSSIYVFLFDFIRCNNELYRLVDMFDCLRKVLYSLSN